MSYVIDFHLPCLLSNHVHVVGFFHIAFTCTGDPRFMSMDFVV